MGIREEIVAMFLVLSVPTYECVGRGSEWAIRKAIGSLATGERPRALDDADRWLRASPEERATIAGRLVRTPAPVIRRLPEPRRYRDRAAYMREFRRSHGSPPRWARKSEEQREAQRASVRRWRERQRTKTVSLGEAS